MKGYNRNIVGLSIIVIVGIALFCTGCNKKEHPPSRLLLWYTRPAVEWTDALPIGNGRLGAMIFGGVKQDHIQINEETFWTAGPRDYNRENAFQYLPRIRKLLFEGRQDEAEALAQKHFMGTERFEDIYDSLFNHWLDKVRADENLEPADPAYDDSKWKTMKIPTGDGFERVVPAMEGENGAFWFRISFDLKAGWKGKPLILDLGNVRDIDFTYVNGHFLGSHKSKWDFRKYTIPAGYLREKGNVVAIQVINPDDKGGLAGYHFTEDKKTMAIYPKGTSAEKGISLERAWKFKIQNDNPPPFPHYEASYQPFADLWLKFFGLDSVTHYKRSLDISNAISRTVFKSSGITYKRTYFASHPAQAIVVHLTSDHNNALNFQASLSSKHKLSDVKKLDDHTIVQTLKIKGGVLKGESRLRVIIKGGEVAIDSSVIAVKNADEATLYIVAGTNFVNYHQVNGNPSTACVNALASLDGKSYETIRTDHVQAYQKYFNTFSIDLGQSKNAKLPTDVRIRRFMSDTDPALVALYLQYARYLLISSSWPGTLPPNLQGIWNDQMRPPWGSKYTTNINLEMNYWPAEVLNLSRLHEPLFTMMMGLAEKGKKTAREYYGCPGWVLHHNTDIWLGTAPIDKADHGIWPTGGAWLCHQLWQHYQFTQEEVFLKDTAYPIMKSAAKFFSCFLIEDPKTGWLISSPSNSPEHGGLVAGPTMDHQIIRDLFKNCIQAAEILGVDSAFADTLKQQYKRIAPNQIGQYGQLQEWLSDIDDTSDHYRHVSHLWGVFPGTDITWKDTALMKAARQSLIYRGDEGTGWSLAWKINLWTMFKEGNHAYKLLQEMLSPAQMPGRKNRGGSYNNLFDAHPPFQIDGNFGGATGIANMLVQSETGIIELLPALPDALPAGQVKGICARGGFVLNVKWNEGQLQKVKILSRAGKKCIIKYGDKMVNFKTGKNKTYVLNGDLLLQE